MSVEKASPELQLAVDLIYLLECNEIAPETALAALAIVQLDYQRKLRNQTSDGPDDFGCLAKAIPLSIALRWTVACKTVEFTVIPAEQF